MTCHENQKLVGTEDAFENGQSFQKFFVDSFQRMEWCHTSIHKEQRHTPKDLLHRHGLE